jgi:hypothetical protein
MHDHELDAIEEGRVAIRAAWNELTRSHYDDVKVGWDIERGELKLNPWIS